MSRKSIARRARRGLTLTQTFIAFFVFWLIVNRFRN